MQPVSLSPYKQIQARKYNPRDLTATKDAKNFNLRLGSIQSKLQQLKTSLQRYEGDMENA